MGSKPKKEIIYCPKCRTPMNFDRTESSSQKDIDTTDNATITWNIYRCPECKFESLRRKY